MEEASDRNGGEIPGESFRELLGELLGELPGEFPGELLGVMLGELPGELPGESLGKDPLYNRDNVSSSSSVVKTTEGKFCTDPICVQSSTSLD